MAALVRSHDWGSTPLGPIENWPQSLKTAVGIVLGSRLPMLVAWGPMLVSIFNDACLPMLGSRGVGALGRPYRKLWPGIWEQSQPRIDEARSGEGSWAEDLPIVLNRDGCDETAYFTFSYSPLQDDDERSAGVLATIVETTARVDVERRNIRLLAESRASEERARDSEKRFELLADGAPVVIWTTDARGDVQFVNSAYREFFGVTDEQARQNVWRSATHPDDAPAFIEAYRDAVQAHRPYCRRRRVRRADGEWRWVESHGVPRHSTAGEFLGHTGIILDVTDAIRAEEALRDSEARGRLALTAAELGTWEHDLASDLFHADDLARAHYGLDHNIVPFRELLSRIHPDDLSRLRRSVEAALDPHIRGPVATEYRVLRPDGGIRWLSIFGQVHFEGAGAAQRPIRGVGTTQDITVRKLAEVELRASEQRFRELADAMPQIVYAADGAGIIRFVNRQWKAYTGRPGVTIGELLEVTHPDDLPELVQRWKEAVRTRTQVVAQFRLRAASDGEYRWFLTRAVPLCDADGRIDRWYGTSTDVDAQTRHAEALQQAHDALKEADRRKDTYLVTLAHELRNPLAPIRTSLALLEREPHSERGRQALEMSRRQLHQLTRLVDDLLEVSRLLSGKIRLRREPVTVAAAVDAAVEAVRSEIDKRRQQMAVVLPDEPVVVVADPVRVAQVLENLLHNASKFTSDGGSIRIEVDDDPSGVEIRVIDDGIGIAPAQMGQLFQLFVQADQSLDRPQGGLGIGLAVVRQLVELHGGSVRAHSEGLGRGARFIVRLPHRPAADASAAA